MSDQPAPLIHVLLPRKHLLAKVGLRSVIKTSVEIKNFANVIFILSHVEKIFNNRF